MSQQKVVVTQAGDTWDRLAKKLYGDERFMDRLIKANLSYRMTVIFSSGVVLNVPDVDAASSGEDVNLPRWKRRRGNR